MPNAGYETEAPNQLHLVARRGPQSNRPSYRFEWIKWPSGEEAARYAVTYFEQSRQEHEANDRAREARPRRKPKPIVYGTAWGAWTKRNVERDLRSGALGVNAEGATIH